MQHMGHSPLLVSSIAPSMNRLGLKPYGKGSKPGQQLSYAPLRHSILLRSHENVSLELRYPQLQAHVGILHEYAKPYR